eukprot:1164829-Rhodomonas_salina.3
MPVFLFRFFSFVLECAPRGVLRSACKGSASKDAKQLETKDANHLCLACPLSKTDKRAPVCTASCITGNPCPVESRVYGRGSRVPGLGSRV